MRHDEKQKCETEYCRVQMMNNGWPSGCCGKSAKGKLADGTPACGVHISAERRREQNANKGAEERRKEREFANEVRALLEPLGISGHATGYRHRQCIVNFDDLSAVMRKNRCCCNCASKECDTINCRVSDTSYAINCLVNNRKHWKKRP